MTQQPLQESDWRFVPEIDMLWDALTRRGMHYDRAAMEREEPALANRQRASLDLALGEGGWVPRSVADAGDNFKVAVVDALRYSSGPEMTQRLWNAVADFKEALDPEEAER